MMPDDTTAQIRGGVTVTIAGVGNPRTGVPVYGVSHCGVTATVIGNGPARICAASVGSIVHSICVHARMPAALAAPHDDSTISTTGGLPLMI